MGKKRIGLFVLGICSVFLLAACGGGSNDKKEAADSKENEKLVLYTNADSDGRGEWLEKKAKEAGFEISLVGGGGADIKNRLISEKSNSVADVVYGLNSMFYEQLKEEEVLQEYKPTWADEVEEGINDPANYYHGLVKQALLLSYNPNVFTEKTAPKGYLDLVDNKAFYGKYEAPNQLDQATPRIILSSILSQFKDDNGEMGVSKEGWKTMETFLKNGVPTPEGEDIYAMFASEETPIATLVSGTLDVKKEQFGVGAEFVSPEVGSPLVVEQVAIVKGTKKEKTAEKFVDWLGSAEVQGQFASEFNAMPANTVAAEKANEDVQKMYDKIKAQELDWAFISEHIESWMEKIELELL